VASRADQREQTVSHRGRCAMMPHMSEVMEAMRTGQPAQNIDLHKLYAGLARLPDKPDENLR